MTTAKVAIRVVGERHEKGQDHIVADCASLFSRVIRNLDFDDGGQAHHECGACRFDGNSCDPGPSRRGDVARALFYMDLRYDGSEGGTPDLELVDRTTAIGERHLGHLCQLVVWHGEDLVDDAERRRNDVIFAWQGNRNPFVDHPEWVRSIWGGACR